MSYVVGNFVGNCLGENKPNQAKTYVISSIILIIQFAAVILVIISIFKNEITLIYTTEPKVAEYVKLTLPAFTVTIF